MTEYYENLDDNKTLDKKHYLHGFRLEIVDWPHYLATDMCIKLDNRKTILCNCNGALSEIDITETENDLAEQLAASQIDKLKRKYDFSMDKGMDFTYCYPHIFHWKMDCSLDDKHYMSSGDYVPDELYSVIVVLRKNGISSPLAKVKTKYLK